MKDDEFSGGMDNDLLRGLIWFHGEEKDSRIVVGFSGNLGFSKMCWRLPQAAMALFSAVLTLLCLPVSLFLCLSSLS